MELLYPELLTNEQLLAHLSTLKTTNLSQCTRNDLIDLFQKHVMPKPSRQKTQATESKPLSTKRQRIVYEGNTGITITPPAQIEQARVGIHQISIRNGTNRGPQIPTRIISLKRSVEKSSEQDNAAPASKRTKITWP